MGNSSMLPTAGAHTVAKNAGAKPWPWPWGSTSNADELPRLA